MGDEILASTRIRPRIERHADGASKIRPLVQLVADGKTRPAFAISARIAVLHHEIGDDAVHAEAVEETPLRELDEVLDRERGVEDRQLDLNRPAIRVEK